MSILPITDAFASYLMDECQERRYSPLTARSYEADLRQFVEFLASHFSLEIDPENEIRVLLERTGLIQKAKAMKPLPSTTGGVSGFSTTAPTTITMAIITAKTELMSVFLAHLDKQSYSPATVARKIATLRSFYKWAERLGIADSNPMILIRSPRREKHTPKTVTIEQAEKLISAPDVHRALGLRDQAMLEMFYSTGIYSSELANLDLCDIDLGGELLKVKGKGKKERTIPIGQRTMVAIRLYVDAVKSHPVFCKTWTRKDERQPFFLNKHGGRLAPRSVRRMFDKYLKQTGLDPTISPRTLRHSFATNLLTNGADIGSVQEVLGHKNLASTQVYACLTQTPCHDKVA